MSTELEIRQLRDEIVSLRDEIRQLRRTIEHERVPIVPYPYPSAQLDFPGFCRDYLAAGQERTGIALADAYAMMHGGPTASTYTDPNTSKQVPWWHQLPKIGIPQHVHRGSAAREAAMDAAAALEDPPN